MATRVVGIVSGKGGVGKTTVAINLATSLAVHYARDVLLIDANITTSHLAVSLGIYKPEIVLNEFLKKDGYRKIKDVKFPHYLVENLQLLPASITLKDLEGINVMNLSKVVDEIVKRKRPEIIILDSAPCLGREALASMFASNSLIMVANPTIQSMIDIIRLVEKSSKIGVDIIGVVMNRVRGESYEINEDDVKAMSGVNVIGKIPYDKKVLESLGKKKPVVIEYPTSKASIAFINLAAFLIGEKPIIPRSRKRKVGNVIRSLLRT